jgi:capsular polysaccharide biosynthesis protein
MTNLLRRIQRGLLRRLDEFLRTNRMLGRWRIDRAVDAESVVDGSITNRQVIAPAQARVSLETNALDRPFLEVCKHFQEGWYSRPAIFTCEVPDAFCHVGTGLVCTRDFDAITDSQMKYRMAAGPAAVGNPIYRPFKWFKPVRVRRLAGTFATIGNVYLRYWGHWVFDCLPRLYSLDQASAGERVVLLVPDDLPASWHESLACVLPSNFEVQSWPGSSWVQVERMLLASYASGLANSHMPREFYDFIRNACFTKFGLPLENRPSERIYVSRAGTRHRRILNEEALVELLGRYGFKAVALEKLTFRQQVELFHRAEIVVGADGSNCANMLFAGRIKVLVLYSDRHPYTHWFTAAKGLGQQHFFLTCDGASMHADFSVDLKALEQLLNGPMELRPPRPV